jgi:hypothetical protein
MQAKQGAIGPYEEYRTDAATIDDRAQGRRTPHPHFLVDHDIGFIVGPR